MTNGELVRAVKVHACEKLNREVHERLEAWRPAERRFLALDPAHPEYEQTVSDTQAARDAYREVVSDEGLEARNEALAWPSFEIRRQAAWACPAG